MVLWLSENDVEEAIRGGVSELVGQLDRACRSETGWDSHPRIRHALSSGTFQYMGAVVPEERAMGIKTYVGSPEFGHQGVVALFDLDSRKLLSVMAADMLGRWRTGAASAVAALHLAKRDSVVFGLIGSARQAETQLAALISVCEIKRAKVFARDHDRLATFCRKAEEEHGITVVPVRTPREAVSGSDIVATATPAREIVLHGSFIDGPCLVNAVGANHPGQQEVDPDAFRMADLVVVDDLEQAKAECGDLIQAVGEGAIEWDDVLTLKSVASGSNSLRTGLSIFESQGIAAWDVIAASFVYRRCADRKLGIEVPLKAED